LSNRDASNADRTAALAAAKADAIDVATYSYLHLHRDFGRVEGESTPSFRHTFIQSSQSLSKVLVQYKATASAKVLSEAVQSISDSKAVVLLFVNQSVKNTAQQGVSTDDSRIEVTLVRSGDRWLLLKLKLL
jgi:Mce-associated membrane protein